MPAVVLTDDNLNALLARPDASGIPCLQFIKVSTAKPCNCSKKYSTPAKKQIDGEHARVCVFQLPKDKLDVLKNLLNATELIIYMTTPGFPRRAVI